MVSSPCLRVNPERRMAKREISSTLKNLKFMQRASQKEEKQKKEEDVIQPQGGFVSRNTLRKCIVIMEGSPHPGALKGRMSFQSYNPSIDKLNEEVANPCQSQVLSTTSGDQISSDREMESSGLDIARTDSDSDVDHKKKLPEVDNGSHKGESLTNANDGGNQCSSGSSKGSSKQRKREKLDWNVLRPPKAQRKGV